MTKHIVREGYDRIAEVYAAWRGADSLKYLERLDRLLEPGSTVLDLGCGAATRRWHYYSRNVDDYRALSGKL